MAAVAESWQYLVAQSLAPPRCPALGKLAAACSALTQAIRVLFGRDHHDSGFPPGYCPDKGQQANLQFSFFAFGAGMRLIYTWARCEKARCV